MKLNNLYSNPSLIAHGLTFKEMKNLKQVVALFGKNGSGKSRLLNSLVSDIQMKVQSIYSTKNTIAHLKNDPMVNIVPNKKNTEIQLENQNRILEELLSQLQDSESNSVISLKGKNDIIIAPHENMLENEYRGNTIAISSNPNFITVKQNCTKYIKALCKSEMAKKYHSVVPGMKFYATQDDIQQKNINLLNLLREVIKEIMNKDLEYSIDEHLTPIVTLDKRVLNPNELSDGERELLAYCTYLVLQRQDNIENKSLSLKGKILLIDEIELFLHPKAQIDLLKGLRNLVGESGQIWLATHSLPILSILDRDEIWLMEDGDIISPGIQTPNKVLKSLIGEDNIDSLENFLSSQYEWASIQFALESLFPPAVIGHKEEDAQQSQLKDVLGASSKPLKILDFGAGHGRIARELIRNPNLSNNIYYQALEQNANFHGELEELTRQLQELSSIDSDKEREVLDSFEKLCENQYNSFFDHVFLINTLHEIKLNKWILTLNTILQSLKPGGKLIILEDQAIPRGENAHEYGFLILDKEEFKILFSRKNLPKCFKHDNPSYSDRLLCIEIPKEESVVNNESLKEALNRKKINCKTEINVLRSKNGKIARDGRLNSFYTQLYGNVDMALVDLGGK